MSNFLMFFMNWKLQIGLLRMLEGITGKANSTATVLTVFSKSSRYLQSMNLPYKLITDIANFKTFEVCFSLF